MSGISKVHHAHLSLTSSLVRGAIKYAHFELHAAIANADNFRVIFMLSVLRRCGLQIKSFQRPGVSSESSRAINLDDHLMSKMDITQVYLMRKRLNMYI